MTATIAAACGGPGVVPDSWDGAGVAPAFLDGWSCVEVIDGQTGDARPVAPDELQGRLAAASLVYLGERHGVAQIQHAQWEVAAWLAGSGALLIGVEMLPWTFSEAAEAWSAGALDEEDFLQAVEWERTWGSAWELYAPVFRLARSEGVALVALNAPRMLSRAVFRQGWDGVDAELGALLPEEWDDGDSRYRRFVTAALAHHGSAGEGAEEEARMQRFFEAQLVWDETMAERVVAGMAAKPEARMVVLAGAMHVAGGHGIPSRVERRGGPAGLRVVLQVEPVEEVSAWLPLGAGDLRCSVPGAAT